MFTNDVFFFAVMLTGAVLAGFSGLIGVSRARDDAERTGLRLLLELTLATVCFALLPFPLYAALNSGVVVWSLASLTLGLYLLLQLTRIYAKASRYRIVQPLMTMSLLVFSAIVFTIEVINVFWWHTLAGYAGGLLWLLVLSAVQYIAYICYDRSQLDNHVHQATSPYQPRYRGLAADRLRRHHLANHPHRET